MEFRLKNSGSHDLWVTVVYLEANLGIKIFESVSIQSGKSMRDRPS